MIRRTDRFVLRTNVRILWGWRGTLEEQSRAYKNQSNFYPTAVKLDTLCPLRMGSSLSSLAYASVGNTWLGR